MKILKKKEKVQGLTKYPNKYGIQWHSITYCLDSAKPYLNRTQLSGGQRAAPSLS